MAGEKQRAAQRERFKAAALDVGKGWTGPGGGGGSVVDAAIDEAVATTAERASVRVAVAGRDPQAIQAAQRALSAKKVELRQGQGAAQQQRQGLSVPEWRATVRKWLLGMNANERAELEDSEDFNRYPQRSQREILKIRDRVDAEMSEVSYELGYDFETAVEDDYGDPAGWAGSELAGELADDLAAGWEESDESDDELGSRLEEIAADRLEAEGEAVYAAWESGDEEGEE